MPSVRTFLADSHLTCVEQVDRLVNRADLFRIQAVCSIRRVDAFREGGQFCSPAKLVADGIAAF